MKEIGAEDRKHLTDMLGESSIFFDEPMSRHTSFRAGGTAAAYAAPDSREKLISLILWAGAQSVLYSIVGDGTNLLVKDSGYPGILIVLTKCLREMKTVCEKDETVIIRAGAGVRMKNLCRFAMQNRLEDISPLLGIPGTVGGGIVMNAGTARGETADMLNAVTVLFPDGNIREIPRDALCFTYRRLRWDRENISAQGKEPVILEGDFLLHKSAKTVAELEAEAQIILAHRRKTQPLEFPSAGCFFKNPGSGISAGELIDRAGLKGMRVGGAEVSAKHANFIINRDQASASDILALADRVKDRVSESFGTELEREVWVIG